MSVEEALWKRKSVRRYLQEPMTLDQLSQILWASQGITDSENGHAAAPSPGAKHTLELYVIVPDGGVTGLLAGVYHYAPSTHDISLVRKGDYASSLQEAATGQGQIDQAALILVIAAVFTRATIRCGERGPVRHTGVGCAVENINVESMALGLGTVVIGAFDENWVGQLIGTGKMEKPLLLVPVGALVQ